MRTFSILALYILLVGMTPLAASKPELKDQSLTELENRLVEIDSELEQLASYSLRGGAGSVGYRSRKYNSPHSPKSIRIMLGDTFEIDQVVLVPALWRDSKTGLRSEGFPLAFRILAGTDSTSSVLSTFTEQDNHLPRIAPLVVSFPKVKASWVTIEVETLSLDIGAKKHSLQLSEILVFSGLENVALQTRVTILDPAGRAALNKRSLTDGFSPFLMDAAQGEPSNSQLLSVKRGSEILPSLTIDLQESYPINQINLHTANIALSYPMAYLNSWGVPRHVRATGANESDFSDASVLFDHKQRSINDTGPIIMQRFPERQCRYVRFTIVDHRPVVSAGTRFNKIAVTEFEVLSAGQNVALNKEVTASRNLAYADFALPLMTDGLNYYGNILPTKVWMNQLAQRHNLETERPIVRDQLNDRYASQKSTVKKLIWAGVLLAACTCAIIFAIQRKHRMQLVRLRERIAADLHDELGANFHTIALLSQLVEKKSEHLPGEVSGFLKRIQEITGQSGIAVRHISRMQEAGALCSNIQFDMQRAAERIVVELKHDIEFEGQEYLAQLRPQTRIDLFLFYKECLVNICRHSGATELSTRLKATSKDIHLTITDNGSGIDGAPSESIPSALHRRARLMGANVSVDSPSQGGTQISLIFRPRRGLRLKKIA